MFKKTGILALAVLLVALCLRFLGGCGGGSSGGGGGIPTQTVRFRIINNCSYTIWIQQANMPSGTPEVSQLASGGYIDYSIPSNGLASTRYWPKTGCDSTGQNCATGQSSDPCPATGCAPPTDSKLEATWGCTLSNPQMCASTPQGELIPNVTSWDTSAVDGYSLPYKVEIISSGGTNCTGADCSSCINVDCTNLSLDNCPTDENLSQGQTTVHDQYASENLQVLSTNNPGTVLGCYSPCKKLNYPSNTGFNGEGLAETSDEAIMYCCPTPPITPDACRAGPAATTKYLQLIHGACTGGVYAYAYDDVTGLHFCAGPTQFLMTFCP